MALVDHLIYAAPDLDAGVERLESILGVRAVPGGRHPGYGTRNALLALGPETYLEVLAPDPDGPEPERPRLFGIDRLDAPGLAAWVAKESDLEGRVEAADRRGVRLGEILSGGRERPDGSVLAWRLTDPHVVLGDGIVPFLIDWGTTESPARAAPKGCTLLRLRAEHPDPARIGEMLLALGVELAVEVELGRAPALIATIGTARGEVELT